MSLTARLLSVAAFSLLSGAAVAQSMNIDVGSSQIIHRPSSSFGAAANQPGVWNMVSGNTASTGNLVDLAGTVTGAHMSHVGGFGNFQLSNPTWTGDDELLLERAVDVGATNQGGGIITWTLGGLTGGTYEVTTYAIAPDLPATYKTRVVVTNALEGPQVVGGAWTGQPYLLGATHAKHTVTITGGQSITIVTTDPGFPAGNLSTVNGFQVKAVGGGGPSNPGTAYCFGDGTATACPCGNASAFGANEGCLNSLTLGAKLVATGNASLGGDTVVLQGSQMPNSSALYFQGTAQQSAGLGAVFGDGLRCAAGSITRLGTKVNAGGVSSYPTGGDQTVSVRGAVLGAGTREYQVWYRNSADFCTPSTFNLSNGLQITWAP